MCPWLAYSGPPVRVANALSSPAHSLIDPSLHPRLGGETTNGDGFGVAWYGQGRAPAVFRGIEPVWNDVNLRGAAAHVTSPLFFTHIRTSSGTAVQATNCHPFRHGCWLWMHNGLINGFSTLKRDLVLDIDPAVFPAIEGQTDSEVLFFLGLTLGLEDDPPAAVAGAVGMVEAAARRRGVEHPMQGTIATTDGRRLWVFRYSSAGRSRSLFFTSDVATLRRHYPQLALQQLSAGTHLVVSEPLGDPAGVWSEMPESSYGVIDDAGIEILPFVPPRTPRAQRPAHVAGSWPA